MVDQLGKKIDEAIEPGKTEEKMGSDQSRGHAGIRGGDSFNKFTNWSA
jgi:hypothetical protein